MKRTEFGEIVAEQVCKLELPTGEHRPVVLRIGRPYRVSDEEWRCPCEIAGFEDRYADIAGVSSLQALCLAIALLRGRLEDLLRSGVKLVDEESSEPWAATDVASLFGARVANST